MNWGALLGFGILAVWLAVLLGCMFVVGRDAKRRGSPYWGWHVVGAFLFAIPYVVIYYVVTR